MARKEKFPQKIKLQDFLDRLALKKEQSKRAKEIKALHKKIEKFSESVLSEPFNNNLSLRTENGSVDWGSMPTLLSHYFEPELLNYPEKITKFSISNSIPHHQSKQSIKIGLERNGEFWSGIYVGTEVREDQTNITVEVICSDEEVQNEASSEYGVLLKDVEDYERKLGIIHIVSQFAFEELERQSFA